MTNAIIGKIDVQINLYDPRDNIIGVALTYDLIGLELWPNEDQGLHGLGDSICYQEGCSWEIEVVEFEAVRVVEPDVMTVSTGVTWGQVKGGIGGEE